MFNVRLAGGYLYGKQLFTWLSLAVSLMASFVLSFFPLDVLDEIWDLIESVSEGFLTCYFIQAKSIKSELEDVFATLLRITDVYRTIIRYPDIASRSFSVYLKLCAQRLRKLDRGRTSL